MKTLQQILNETKVMPDADALFIKTVLLDCERQLAKQQAKLPDTKEFDSLAQSIANTRGSIDKALSML
jgi:hypothetical protein